MPAGSGGSDDDDEALLELQEPDEHASPACPEGQANSVGAPYIKPIQSDGASPAAALPAVSKELVVLRSYSRNCLYIFFFQGTPDAAVPPLRNFSDGLANALSEVARTHVYVERYLRRKFHAIGCWVATLPLTSFFGMFALCAIVSSGIAKLKYSDDVDAWYPHNTQAYDDAAWRNSVFGFENKTAVAIAYIANDSWVAPGVLGHTALSEVFTVYSTLMNLSDSAGPYDPALCARSCASLYSCPCKVYSIFPVFSQDGNSSITSLTIPDTDENILEAIDQRNAFQGVPILEAVLGNTVYFSGPEQRIAGAQAAIMQFELSDTVSETTSYQWQNTFRQQCDVLSARSSIISVTCTTSNELSIETEEALNDDQVYVVIAILMMLCYVSLVLARFDCVDSRYLLSLAIILIIGLALGVAFGIAGFMGLIATQCSFLAVFILFGLGVDNMFLLVDAFDRNQDESDLVERCAQATSEVGGSILYTSATTCVALLVGSTIDLPAVQSFCITTGIAVLFAFSIAIMMFMPLLVLNEKRISMHRYDCAPCVISAKSAAMSASGNDKSEGDKNTNNRLRHFMKHYLVPLVTRPLVPEAIVLLFTIMFMSLGIYGITHINKTFNAFDYLPDSSPLRSFVNTERQFFGGIIDLDFLLDHPQVNERQTVRDICTVGHRVQNLKFVLQPTKAELMPFWGELYGAFYGSSCARNVTTGATGTLWNCSSTADPPPLQSPNAGGPSDCFGSFVAFTSILDSGRISNNFRFNSSGSLIAAKYTVLANFTHMMGYNYDAMDQARAVTTNLTFHTRAFAVDFLQSERSRIVDQLTMTAVSSTIIAVFVVSLFALSPIEAFIITCGVVMVILDLIGLMSLWQVNLNVTSIVFLCLAVGFSVDYAAHVTKSVSDQNNDFPMSQRVKLALEAQGVPVVHAAFSTLVATVMLSVASNLAYRILFRMLLGTVVFGILHGIVWLPAVLQILPAHVHDASLHTCKSRL